MKCQQKKSLNCVRLKVKDCNALSWAHHQSNLLFLLLPAFLGRSEKKVTQNLILKQPDLTSS